MKINFQAPPKNLDEKMVYNILRDYKMLNAEVLFRDDEGECDDVLEYARREEIDTVYSNRRRFD